MECEYSLQIDPQKWRNDWNRDFPNRSDVWHPCLEARVVGFGRNAQEAECNMTFAFERVCGLCKETKRCLMDGIV